MKKLPKNLSSTLSTAIRQALEDLEACELDDRYQICMGVWHQPEFPVPGTPDPKCHVCFAGAVMAKRIGVPIGTASEPGYTGREKILFALDCVRVGGLPMSLRGSDKFNGVIEGKTMMWLRYNEYRDNPKKFKSCLLRVASMLERRGA